MNEIELNEFRIARLTAAVDHVSKGNKTDFGRRLGYKDGAFVRQMLSGIRPVTEKTVWAIEAMPGMKGWFEPDGPSVGTADVQQTADWPFPEIPEDQVRALPPAKLSALQGAMALAIAQMNMGITVAPAPVVQPAASGAIRTHRPGGLVDIDHADDAFPMRIKDLEPGPWEGGKTTKQMEDARGGVLISHAVDVGHVPDSGYSANDHEFIPIPELDVRLAAGALGIENYQETEIGQILLRRSFLESFGLPIEQMRIVYSHGDSMEPAIRNRNPMLMFIESIHDMLQINRRIIYAINQGGSMLVKCISRTRDGIWLAKSLNPAYKPIPLVRDDGRDVNIVGRILWSPNDLRNGVDERLLRS
ncbi:S24 family peptidase [Achromobacter denitrificans]|uniref:S24 family peptidase n=1 Tax=Achromobacter denitrificans TaxID=32002 RepID=UPI00240E3364|nr:S24 family peptidase [Achromobacter denitrificans]